MAASTTVLSSYYLDHDPCTAHGGPQGKAVTTWDNELQVMVSLWACPCGGVYYVPDFDEVYDL